MKLNIDKIKEITSGAEKIEETENGFSFSRFTDSELTASTSPNVRSSAGIQMEFLTDAKALDITVFVKKVLSIRTYFCFEIFADDKLCDTIKNFDEENMLGNYADVSTYPLGEFSKRIELSSGEKKVRIIFPHSVETFLKNMELSGASYITPVKRKKKIIMFGDSITQGFDALSPSATYALKISDALSAELFNKGIGGELFCPKLVMAENDIKPDYVSVACGTNDWFFSDKDTFIKNAGAFISTVSEKFSYTTVYVITPIWRKDYMEKKPFGDFSEVEQILTQECKKHKNTVVISGMDLVPHDEKMYGDLRLHPNDEGFRSYAEELLKRLECKERQNSV